MLFVVYAVLVWWAALAWRRRWLGFASVGLGVLGVWFLARFYLFVGGLLGVTRTDSFMILVVPFGVIVGVLGLYIACLPVRREGACRRCGYSLIGLEPDAEMLVCPECGARHAFGAGDSLPCTSCGGATKPHGHRDWLCTACGVHLLFSRNDRRGSPEHGAVNDAERQDRQRHTQDDQQPQREQPIRIDRADERNRTRLGALRDDLIREAEPVQG